MMSDKYKKDFLYKFYVDFINNIFWANLEKVFLTELATRLEPCGGL